MVYDKTGKSDSKGKDVDMGREFFFAESEKYHTHRNAEQSYGICSYGKEITADYSHSQDYKYRSADFHIFNFSVISASLFPKPKANFFSVSETSL